MADPRALLCRSARALDVELSAPVGGEVVERSVSHTSSPDRSRGEYPDAGTGLSGFDQRKAGALMGTERVLEVGASDTWDVGRLGWPWRVVGLVAAVLLVGVLGAGRARAALPSNCAQTGEDIACTFSSTGFPDQTFKVPVGISSVNIVAVGAPGGAGGPRFPSPVPGGAGAVASGTLSVTGGQTLYVEVGGAGGNGFDDGAAGFNGGGPGDTASRTPEAPAVAERRMCAALRIQPIRPGSTASDRRWRRRRRRTRRSPDRSGRCWGRSRATGSRRHSTELPGRGWGRFAGHDQSVRQRRQRRRGR